MGEVVTDDGVLTANEVGSMPAARVWGKRKSAAKGEPKKSAKKWVWAPFESSARGDGLELFHWQKAGVEYADYPYARFNVGLERIRYTDHDYERYLRDANWTKSETDYLMTICHKFELRWPVIADRYEPVPPRPMEQLQARYYLVAHTVLELKTREKKEEEDEAAADPEAQLGISARSRDFDAAYEEKRRRQLNVSFSRSRAEEAEERTLRDELKAVEFESRRLKKMAKGGSSEKQDVVGAPAAAISSAALAAAAAASAPRRPTPGVPYLQSGRLRVPDQGGSGLSRAMVHKLNLILGELGVSQRPIPTKLVCDAYDTLRRDIVTLLSLQKLASKKEAELRQLRRHEQQRAEQQRTAASAAQDKSKAAAAPAPAPAPVPQDISPGVTVPTTATPAPAVKPVAATAPLAAPVAAASPKTPKAPAPKRKAPTATAQPAAAVQPAPDQPQATHLAGTHATRGPNANAKRARK